MAGVAAGVCLLPAGCSEVPGAREEFAVTDGDLRVPGDFWRGDFSLALEEARRDGKPMLLYFTGSDWCGPCGEWNRRILTSETFRDFAQDNLVLVKLDFPAAREQSVETVHQNRLLQARFAVNAFPTLLLLDPDGGEEIDRMAMVIPERPRDFIGWLDEAAGGLPADGGGG